MIVYREVKTLAADLGFSARSLYSLTNNIDRHYRRVRIKKHNGYRQLCVPDNFLKAVQRRIYTQILAHMPISQYAAAYRSGASIQKNAAAHCGKSKVLRLDIAHCFDSVLYSHVKAIFSPEIFSEQNRILLAMLCYFGDALPQGAPTSPAIINIIFRDFDNAVGAFCRERDITYTRYCDDLIFSGDFPTDEVYAFVRHELDELGFFINKKKTRCARNTTRQIVTGLVVNERVNTASQYRRNLRQEIYYCQKFGVASHMERAGETNRERYLQSLIGRVNFALQSGGKEFAEAHAWLLAQLINHQKSP